jgi:hypothetical protein
MFKFWCVVCPSILIHAYWHCSMLGSTSIASDTCVVGRAQTLGIKRPGYAPNSGWIV